MKKLLIGLLFSSSLAYGSQIVNPATSGGGGGGTTVYPATATASFPFGFSASTAAFSGVVTAANGTTNSQTVNYFQLSNFANANILINGNFYFWQRGTTFTVTNSSTTIYTADRWQANAPNVFLTVAQENSTVQTGSSSSMKVTFGSVIVGNGSNIQQLVENYWEYAGSSVTFAIQENSSKTQTWHISISDSNGTTSSANCASSSAWTSCTVTRFISSGITSLKASINFDASTVDFGTLYIDQAMFTRGQEAMPFFPRSIQVELALCQRYFFKTFPLATTPAQNTGSSLGALTYSVAVAALTQDSVALPFPVQMRVAPTITFYSIGAATTAWWNVSLGQASGASSIPGTGPSTRNVDVRNAQAAGDGAGNFVGIHLTADAEM